MKIPQGSVISARDCSQENSRNPLRWDLSPDEIRIVTDTLIARVKKVYDDVGSLHIESVSAENTLEALANAKLDYAWSKPMPIKYTRLSHCKASVVVQPGHQTG
ncbi:neurolysin, mitochondrial-like isoform X2 [Gambusia affinis]|nr:neurolysin, mitochondrial-like isoform X2 [Gambusia affinis]